MLEIIPELVSNNIKETYENIEKSYNNVVSKAKELSKIRKEIALKVTNEILNNLRDLSLEANMEIVFKDTKFNDPLNSSIFKEDGIDEIDFMIETNKGEGLSPLSKTASGGEISRIMLAFKALFVKSQKISTIVFDEIDTGISGYVARRVAEKIYDISLSTQVIAISHLPQVSSLSNHHLLISKTIKDDRTSTQVKKLSLDEKIYQIALMISDGKVTDSMLEYAKEMIMNR